MQKLKKLLTNKDELMELIRYIVAGVLTTLLSLVITYGCEFLLALDHFKALTNNQVSLIPAIIQTINAANAVQVMVSTLISWVVAVIFAFWINRRMVFRVQGGTFQSKMREFLAFVGARLLSWAIIEEGIAMLLKWVGVNNIWNRLIVLVLVTIFNYVASKFWIFKPRVDTDLSGQASLTPDEGEVAASAPVKTER